MENKAGSDSTSSEKIKIETQLHVCDMCRLIGTYVCMYVYIYIYIHFYKYLYLHDRIREEDTTSHILRVGMLSGLSVAQLCLCGERRLGGGAAWT